MRSAKLYQYQLPMDSGVILREQKLTQREGFIVELEQDGKMGRGEIAPLIGFSRESLQEAGALAKEQLALWVQGKEGHIDNGFPSVAFGLSMAQMELAGELSPEGQYHSAPLCSGDPDELIPLLNAMPGQKVAKVKVGLYEPIRDGMLVNLFLESMPDLQLRLDANQAWSKEKAAKFAQYVSPSVRGRIAFLEEPCRSPSDSLAFAIDSGIAIAWDETLQHAVQQADFQLEDLTGAKAIVIKPTLIGSVQRCQALIEKARSLGIQAVISSSLESSLGLTQLARLSHWLLPETIPGLDTIGLFKAQLETPWPGCTLPVHTLEQQTLVWQSA
ncbi:o-succinylbenzoate synthase [Vibrio metschnikovii]|uniref:o-succinylbenzoate synthase n=3 Tax=Unclassified Bacteria TaxID=49928 RepID=A0AAU6TFF0_UNCXX|nr:o-succinylbenzoate synthase [Vibrio metschnikovii]EKO3589605.1 o-succinylbenzoate synthase [Vibrio metschnikovii]EKO3642214.1 o-succinylbenzoate synthase [Vibrio metschnikovii]EKO3665463.1 o-succinylbenzoate synthase [Vibrio metschnikovii]EKO3696019.1 o-succinylbenzoate synthase [Vibrio metschnikovii]EKO3717982.1 o-succinylbenzoate synthase [Vibrio metschnikovii]